MATSDEDLFIRALDHLGRAAHVLRQLWERREAADLEIQRLHELLMDAQELRVREDVQGDAGATAANRDPS